MSIVVEPSLPDDVVKAIAGRTLGNRIVDHGQTVYLGDYGRVVKFTREEIPGGAFEFDLRHQLVAKHWYAVVVYYRCGTIHGYVLLDRYEGAVEVANGTHPKQNLFTWTSR